MSCLEEHRQDAWALLDESLLDSPHTRSVGQYLPPPAPPASSAPPPLLTRTPDPPRSTVVEHVARADTDDRLPLPVCSAEVGPGLAANVVQAAPLAEGHLQHADTDHRLPAVSAEVRRALAADVVPTAPLKEDHLQHAAAIEAMRTSHEQELAAVEARHSAALELARQSAAAFRTDRTADDADARAQDAALQAATIAALEMSRTETSHAHSDAMAALRARHADELAAVERAAAAKVDRMRTAIGMLKARLSDAAVKWTHFRTRRESDLAAHAARHVASAAGGAASESTLASAEKTVARDDVSGASGAASAAWEEARRHYDARISTMKEVTLRLVADESDRANAQHEHNTAVLAERDEERAVLLGEIENLRTAEEAAAVTLAEATLATRHACEERDDVHAELARVQAALVGHAARGNALEEAHRTAKTDAAVERARWQKLFKLQTQRLQRAALAERADAETRAQTKAHEVAALTAALRQTERERDVARRSSVGAQHAGAPMPASARDAADVQLGDDGALQHLILGTAEAQSEQVSCSLLSARDAARIALIDRRLASIEESEVSGRIQTAVAASVPGAFAPPAVLDCDAAGPPPHASAFVASRGISEQLHLARMTVQGSTVNARLEDARIGAEQNLRGRALREEATQRRLERLIVVVAGAARARVVCALKASPRGDAHVTARAIQTTAHRSSADGCSASTLQHLRLAPIHLAGSLDY